MTRSPRFVPPMRIAMINLKTVNIVNTQNVYRDITRQRGAVTVFVALVLMMVMTIMVMTVGKFAYVEQETAGANYRAREASEATSAGLEYAMAWLDDDNSCDNCTTGVALNFEGSSVANLTMPDIIYDAGDNDPATGTGYTYNPTVTLTQGNNFASGFMLLESTLGTVAGNTESGVTINGSEQVYVTLWNQYMTSAGQNAPPLVINGCLENIIGGPTIFPSAEGPAIYSVGPDPLKPHDWTAADAPNGFCLDPGHMDVQLCGGDTCAVGGPGDNVTGTDLEDFLEVEDQSVLPHPQAWNYLFQISLPEAKAMAATAGQSTSDKNAVVNLQPVDDDYMPFIVYSGKTPLSGDFGTPDYPVVLIITDEDCPQFNGGPTIYGVLYYEDPLDKCNGMGGANVIGSGVFEGNANKLNANTEFYHATAGGGTLGGPLYTEKVARIPGTWRDW